MKCSEHNTLDCMYLELMPQLYRSVLHKVKKQIPCQGNSKVVHCSGAANILLQMQVLNYKNFIVFVNFWVTF